MPASPPEWPASLDEIMPVVYDELRKLARAYLARESSGHTLPATALVHELYVRLLQQRDAGLESREQFFALSARMLRRILVDHARRKRASKRGAGQPREELLPESAASLPRYEDAILLDEALGALEAIDPRAVRLLDLHYYLGLSAEEITPLSGLEAAAVYQELRAGKAWLKRHIQGRQAP
jgi:RNA polymerase sigma-70 factor, ECF subfamily